jgi:hypothetical protein
LFTPVIFLVTVKYEVRSLPGYEFESAIIHLGLFFPADELRRECISALLVTVEHIIIFSFFNENGN